MKKRSFVCPNCKETPRTGGNYEGWLIEFDEAASFLQKYHEQVGE